MILDISEGQDTMSTHLKSKMSTQLLPYLDLKSQQNGSQVKEEPTEASACTKLLEDRSSPEAAIGPQGLTESSSPFHMV